MWVIVASVLLLTRNTNALMSVARGVIVRAMDAPVVHCASSGIRMRGGAPGDAGLWGALGARALLVVIATAIVATCGLMHTCWRVAVRAMSGVTSIATLSMGAAIQCKWSGPWNGLADVVMKDDGT